MAVHYKAKVGVYSELIAKSALIVAGWDAISEPYTAENYDISARHPVTGAFSTFQVKTVARRSNFRGSDWLVMHTSNGAGQAYDVENAADYYIGVLVDDGAMPRVYLLTNDKPAKREWWAKANATAAKGWVELAITLDREALRNDVV